MQSDQAKDNAEEVKTDFDNTDLALNSLINSEMSPLAKNVRSLKTNDSKLKEPDLANILDSLREQLMAEDENQSLQKPIALETSHPSNPFELDASNLNRDSNVDRNKPNETEAQKRLFDYEPTHIEGYKVADLSMSMQDPLNHN